MKNAPSNIEFEEYAKHAHDNELEVLQSTQCGCFFCRHIFSARSIADWIEEDHRVSAVCPECGMDTVIGDNSGVPLSKSLLKEMNQYFYGQADGLDDEAAIRFCSRYYGGKISKKEKNENLYIAYLEQLTKSGSETAAIELANLYEGGALFHAHDINKAIEIYNLPILKTNGYALCRLAALWLYFQDKGKANEAFTLAAKACALGEPFGGFILSDCIYDGIGVAADEELSFSIIEHGYEEYYPALSTEDPHLLEAFANYAVRLGDFYSDGVVVSKDKEAALRFFLFASLACKTAVEYGFPPFGITPEVDSRIKALAKELDLHTDAPVFDSNMFYDSFSYVQDEYSLKHLHIVNYDETSGTLALEINFPKPVALIDLGNLQSFLREGTVRFEFNNVVYFRGEDGDFLRVGSQDGESWDFMFGDEEKASLRFANDNATEK